MSNDNWNRIVDVAKVLLNTIKAPLINYEDDEYLYHAGIVVMRIRKDNLAIEEGESRVDSKYMGTLNTQGAAVILAGLAKEMMIEDEASENDE